LQDVARVLTQLQTLLLQLAEDGEDWQQRLQQLSTGLPDNYDAAVLTAQMPALLRRIPALSWFSNQLSAAAATQPVEPAAAVPAAGTAMSLPGAPPPVGDDAARTGYWDEEKFSLQYHPGGHADDFLKNWLVLSLQLSRADNPLAPFAQILFDQLADSSAEPGEAKGPGRCTKCHSLEQAAGRPLINWRARQPQPQQHDFTRFRHQPHLQLDEAQACTLCHKLRDEEPGEGAKSKFLQSFLRDIAPDSATGNFAAMDKTTCSACHSAAAAGQSCVICHNYHVGDFQPTMLQHTGNLLRHDR
jgi:hypothetical protein